MEIKLIFTACHVRSCDMIFLSSPTVAEWTGVSLSDLVLVRAMLARCTHPEFVREKRSTRHDARRKLHVAVGTNC